MEATIMTGPQTGDGPQYREAEREVERFDAPTDDEPEPDDYAMFGDDE
jgi:hypothetical protein